MENKETFQARLRPFFSPSDQLDIKLAYCLAKFGHRAQTRKELTEEGKPTRYFEHVRRVSIVLMDELRIMDRDMIIAALLHDALEDTQDLSAELLEHSFGSRVTHMVKMLSKVPKEGYLDRLSNCYEWEVLAIKACDRLDNLRSLMIPENTVEFQKKQIEETKIKYMPLFDQMVTLIPPQHMNNAKKLRDEILRLVERYTVMIEMTAPDCEVLSIQGRGI
jgi:(p)ppGpp synthase/HD superfamily hydrolase